MSCEHGINSDKLSFNLKHHSWDFTMADKLSTTATYTASGGAIVFGLNTNEFAAMAGVVIAVLTFLTNLWFKHQHLKLSQNQAAIDQLAREGKIDRRKGERGDSR